MAWQGWGLFVANALTSAITAITGMGGGTILIGLLPIFLPAAVLIPIHATTQLASNVSRAWLSRELICWRFVAPFILGASIGAMVFGILVRYVALDVIPLLIGLYILLTQWSKTVNHYLKRLDNFYLIGFVQMGVGLFVGAPGPLHMPLLLKNYDSATAVSVGSAMMSFVHLGKLLVFIAAGFAFWAYWQVIVLMVVAASVGSYCGLKLRPYVPAHWLKKGLPWLLTLIAVNIIIHNVVKLWHLN